MSKSLRGVLGLAGCAVLSGSLTAPPAAAQEASSQPQPAPAASSAEHGSMSRREVVKNTKIASEAKRLTGSEGAEREGRGSRRRGTNGGSDQVAASAPTPTPQPQPAPSPNPAPAPSPRPSPGPAPAPPSSVAPTLPPAAAPMPADPPAAGSGSNETVPHDFVPEGPLPVGVRPSDRSPSPSPEPSSLLLIGTGLAGLYRLRRKRE